MTALDPKIRLKTLYEGLKYTFGPEIVVKYFESDSLFPEKLTLFEKYCQNKISLIGFQKALHKIEEEEIISKTAFMALDRFIVVVDIEVLELKNKLQNKFAKLLLQYLLVKDKLDLKHLELIAYKQNDFTYLCQIF